MLRPGLPITLALLVAAGLSGCSKSGTNRTADNVEAAKTEASPVPSSPEAAAQAPVLTPDQKKAAVAALPAPFNTGDPAKGEQKFAICRSCHTVAQGGPNLTGPNLAGIFGRKAGTHPDFNYSDVVKAAGFTWDAKHLDTWITDPKAMLPGTKMTFVGMKNPQDRIDLIAYLAAEAGGTPQ